MRVGMVLSSLGGSPLQGGIERGLASIGHVVEPYHRGVGYDLVVVMQQVAHDPDYYFPACFPSENIPIVFVDSSEHGYFARLPDRAREYCFSFTPTVMRQGQKNYKEQVRLKSFLEGRSFPYFLREMHKDIQYPDAFHPIDYPLYHLSHCDMRPDREEYLRRDLELFCSWGESHPFRVHLTQEMRNAHVKSEITVIDRGKAQQNPPGNILFDAQGLARDVNGNAVFMRQDAYFNRMRSAKCSVSFDGYGSSSFRLQEIMVRTVPVMGPLSIVMREPLIDGVHCRYFKVDHAGEVYLGSNVAQVIREVVADPEGSFELYRAAYEHCLEFYTERATAQHILDVVAAHDWSKPTPLEFQ